MKLGKIKKKWIYLNQSELFIQITNLKKALKVHRKIKFNQQDWLRPYIDMNTGLRKKPKNSFEKVFFKLMIKAVFGKAMANMRKNRAIKLVTTESKILINKAVSLGISILDMSKNVIYEFWYDYLKRVWSKCKAIWIQTASLFM